MSKNKNILLIICLILENVIILFLGNLYLQHESYTEIVRLNYGLKEECTKLLISDDLISILQKMRKFHPAISLYNRDTIQLYYGIEYSESPGVGLLFDDNYRLISKACSANWDPVSTSTNYFNL